MLILGIETSCDETAAAVVEYDPRKGCFFIHSNIISSQVKIHAKYGGIVPEVAARNHVINIIPIIDEAVSCRAVSCRAVSSAVSCRAVSCRAVSSKAQKIDAIAVTNGPGLITSLLVGVETAKALAYAWGKPLVAVNHLEGHIYSAIKIQEHENTRITDDFEFPALALIVSGGHTQLVLMTDYGKYKIIGETRDDAAGEAFDKVAKLLGLGYPGGPAIATYAQKIRNPKFEIRNKSKNSNNKFQIELPRPMIESGDFDFSFSGLKTAVLYSLKAISHRAINSKLVEKKPITYSSKFKARMCVEFQQAVIDVLITKTIRAAKKYGAKTVVLAGGVSANKELRKQMGEAIKREIPTSGFRVPSSGMTTDNAAMIAMAGVYHYLKHDFTKIDKIRVNPNLTL